MIIAILIAAGTVYGAIFIWTGHGIPCPLRYITNLKCPGCGVSRMCINLFQGNIAAAWADNAALLCCLPVLLALFLKAAYAYIKTGKFYFTRTMTVLLWSIIVILILFSIYRNVTEHNFTNLFVRWRK